MGIYPGGESFRFCCLHLGFVANICAMTLTAYACLSISLEYFLLSKSSMETLAMKDLTGTISQTITVYFGLRGVAIEKPDMATRTITEQIVVDYDQFCDLASDGMDIYLDSSKDCGSCSSNNFSTNAVISLMMSVTLFFPTFFSQQLRMYSGYDVNCVKNWLTLIGLCTILLNLNVMLTYFYLCSKESFYEDGTVYFDELGNSYESWPIYMQDSVYHEITYERTWGVGLICLVAGTSLKLFDVFCNLAVPTPKVTHDRQEQEIYETIVYAAPGDATDDDENNNI